MNWDWLAAGSSLLLQLMKWLRMAWMLVLWLECRCMQPSCDHQTRRWGACDSALMRCGRAEASRELPVLSTCRLAHCWHTAHLVCSPPGRQQPMPSEHGVRDVDLALDALVLRDCGRTWACMCVCAWHANPAWMSRGQGWHSITGTQSLVLADVCGCRASGRRRVGARMHLCTHRHAHACAPDLLPPPPTTPHTAPLTFQNRL